METPIRTFVTIYILYPPPSHMRRAAAAIGVWGGCRSPCPCHIAAAALRRRIPVPTPTPTC
eukprot:scaffold9547_cov52-Phaeocystis_antarctica.AAC.1